MPDYEGFIARSSRALQHLRERADELKEEPSLLEAVEELATTVEELEVASEELHERNDQLVAARETVEAERRRYRSLFDQAPIPYLTTDVHGVVRESNRAARALLGIRLRRGGGQPLPLLVATDDRFGFRTRVLELAAGTSPQAWEVTFQPPGAAAFTASVEARIWPDRVGAESLILWMVRDVTTARKAQAALQQAFVHEREESAQLRELDAWKDAFMAAAAHDLRSPLMSIVGMAETLLQRGEVVDEATRRHMLAQIASSGRGLANLLEDLLDLDRFTRGVVLPRREPTDVVALVRDAVAAVAAEDHPIDLRLEEVEEFRAVVDAGRVTQIVTNLVSNAVAHTEPGIRVTVQATPLGDDGVQIVVEDEGSGIPEAIRENLFTPFVSSAVRTGGARGHGIGLSLVELFAQLHGGSARAEDRPGGGARFVVELPGPTTPHVDLTDEAAGVP